MAHELDFSRGEAAIAYRGDVPWHGFGNVIESGDSIETIQEKAGLNWNVLNSPAIYEVEGEDGEPVHKSVENRSILYRSDTHDFLSMVSESNYKVRQPGEVLEFFRDLTGNGGFEIEVAGALHGGKKIWALAKANNDPGMIGGDIIKPYLLLVDSYDGTHATTARFTSVRVVCQNTLSFSNKDRATETKRRHSQDFDISKMHQELGAFDESFKEYVYQMQLLAKAKVTDDMKKRFFAKLFAPDVFVSADNWRKSAYKLEEASTNKKNVIADLLNLANGNNPGANLESAENTVYGLLQTVTYFQDHLARTKGGKRWESATIGNGNRMKDAAHTLAMDFA